MGSEATNTTIPGSKHHSDDETPKGPNSHYEENRSQSDMDAESVSKIVIETPDGNKDKPDDYINMSNDNKDTPGGIIVDSEVSATDPMVPNDSRPPRKVPDGGYGWIVVLGCFISHVIMGCLERSDGIYFLQFQKRYGLSAQLTAWPGALVTAARLFLGPVAGALSNRFSVRATCLVGSCLLFIGIFLNGFAPNFYFLFLSHFFIQGIGRGLVYAPGLVIVGMYFDKKRSIATGLSASGVGVGTFLFVPVTQMLFDTYGFGGAFMIIAALALHTSISSMLYRPLSLHYKLTTGKEEKNVDKICLEESLILANAVEASDTQSIQSWKAFHRSMHNVNSKDDDIQIRENKSLSFKKDGWFKSSLKICFPVEKRDKNESKKGKLFNLHLLKNPSFLLFCLSIMLFTAAFKSAFTFIPALVKSLDFSDSEAAYVLSIVGIVDTIGRVALGFLFDRSFVRPLRPLFFTSFLFAIAIISFILPSLNDYAYICFACGVYGFLTGAYVSQKAVINVDILGVSNIASSFGLLICFQGVGVCMGPPLAGALKDATGSFHLSFYLGGSLMICAGCLMVASNIFLRRQRQKEKAANTTSTSNVIQ